MRYENPAEAFDPWLDDPGQFSARKNRVGRLPSEGVRIKKKDSALHLQQGWTIVQKEPEDYLLGQVKDSLHSLSGNLPAESALLVQRFLMSKGPQAVIHHIQNRPPLPDTNSQLELTPYQRLMTRAAGIVCERITHLFLKDLINDEPDKLLLDVGSSTRVSGVLTKASSLYLHPDGMLFSNIDTWPTLEAIYEYKNNPENPEVQDSLYLQIGSIREFLKKMRGKTLTVYVNADRVRKVRFNQITIAENPQIALVIPNNRQAPTDLGDDVNIIPAPFSSKLVSSIASICIQTLLNSSTNNNPLHN